ncbi:DNA-binding protein [Iningainema tapete]|uniref:DNA-binding protein n=1 Tax=Iningainema tapete BLCC-T55 TaxID=2748662 RepID=A0A8J7C3Z6_9CYAN|nr:DNA-binding protein [Iningainema tapete]MBD2770714.1 DNA-binding protein [Iningainema tapete BLCC-T55]
MSEEKSLREKVFEACHNIQAENKKITRDVVRERTGGSNRDVSKYIAEWKAECEKSALAVAGTTQISQQSEESAAIVDDSAPSSTLNIGAESYSNTAQNDLAVVGRLTAERAASILSGEKELLSFFLENPDKLPEDLRQKVERSQNKLNHLVETRKEQHDPDFFAQNLIAQFQ